MSEAIISEHEEIMERAARGCKLSGTCTNEEFYVMGSTNHNSNRRHFVMRASTQPLKTYAPRVGLMGKEALEWSSNAERIITLLNLEKTFIRGDNYVQVEQLGEGSFYRTQWCRITTNPVNTVYVDPRKLWIDVNSIVEI